MGLGSAWPRATSCAGAKDTAPVDEEGVPAYFTYWVPRLFGAWMCILTAIYTGERHDRLFKNAEDIWGNPG